jgi:hypothetical protein
MSTNLKLIAISHTEWQSLQPLSPENDRRLWQKLRLEWNYHSNHIEGNTLTYGETELLLIHGQTHGNHTLREYEEMQAHDVGITHLRELAADQTRLIGETDIRGLNKIILKEPFWKPAQTPDGQATRKQIIPGEYKTTPNNVITATGELFEFAPPSDVPARMQALVKWLDESLHEFRDADLLWLIAKLHHDFVLIHPFDDGNGRVARMLVNYVLMRLGYLPIIVPTERKKDYLTALRLADAGNPAELENFLGSCVLRSLELGIKAAKGESLDEPGDTEKAVAIFIKNQMSQPKRALPRSASVIRDIYDKCLNELINRVRTKIEKLAPLFEEFNENVKPAKSVAIISKGMEKEDRILKFLESTHDVTVEWEFKGFRGKSPSIFGITSNFRIVLKEYGYMICIGKTTLSEKNYAELILPEESESIAEMILAVAFERIKELSGSKGNG